MIQILNKTIPLRKPLPSCFRRFLSDQHDKPDDKPEGSAEKHTKSAPKKPAQPEAGQSRLNDLLASMSTDSTLNLVKTVVAPKQKKTDKTRKADKPKKASTIEEAAQDVAAALGGNVKQTESELLAKLLKRTPGSADVNIADVLSGMNIDRRDGGQSEATPPRTRSTYVRSAMGAQQSQNNNGEFKARERQPRRTAVQPTDPANVTRIDLFGEKPLGIFKELINQPGTATDVLTTWNKLHSRELNLAVTHPPSNHFQKMALWTEQGKLWQFPIDNEQGLDHEASICFTEHIFLDRHLEGWCPSKGPIRHFMELVCVGLSKNPYYTVQQKIDHIQWFRQYFDEKRELLEQVIVHGDSSSGDKTAQAVTAN